MFQVSGKFWQDETGSAIILVVAILTALFGFSALAVDVGMLYTKRVHLNNVADAAALAGVQEAFLDYGNPEGVALDYAVANGILPEDITVSFDDSNKKITVDIRQTKPLFLARVLGQREAQVGASATAQAQALISAYGIIPLAIENVSFEYNKIYNLKTGSPTLGSGEFGALSLGGTGSSNYLDNFKYGYDNTIQIGDIIATETGNMSGATQDAVDYRMNQDPSSTVHDFDRSSPRLVTVPVYEPVSYENNQLKEVRIVGFAAFFITGGTGSGNESYVKGYFVKTVLPGESSLGQSYFGVSSVRLVK